MNDAARKSPAAALFFWGCALVAAALLALTSAAALSGTLGWSPVVGLALGGVVGLVLLELGRRAAKLAPGRRGLVSGLVAALLLGGAAAGVFFGFGLDVEAVIVAGEELAGKERAPAAEVKVDAGGALTAQCEWRDSLPGGGLDEPVFPVIDGWESSMPEHVEPTPEEAVWSMAYRKSGKTVRVRALRGPRFGPEFFAQEYAWTAGQVRGLEGHCVLLPRASKADAVVWRSGKWLVVAESGRGEANLAIGAIAPALLRVFPSDLPRPPEG